MKKRFNLRIACFLSFFFCFIFYCFLNGKGRESERKREREKGRKRGREERNGRRGRKEFDELRPLLQLVLSTGRTE